MLRASVGILDQFTGLPVCRLYADESFLQQSLLNGLDRPASEATTCSVSSRRTLQA